MILLLKRLQVILILIHLAVFSCSLLFAQNKTIDSLLVMLKTDKQDTTYVKNLNLLSKQYVSFGLFKEAKKTILQAQKISNQLVYKSGAIAATYNLVYLYGSLGKQDSALFVLNNMFTLVDTTRNKLQLATIYFRMSYQYRAAYDLYKASQCALKSLTIYERLNDNRGVFNVYQELAAIHAVQKNYKQALNIALKSLKLAKRIGDPKLITGCYHYIGNIYKLEGNENALFYFIKCKEAYEKNGNKRDLISVLNSIGDILKDKKEYNKSIVYFKQALNISLELKDKLCISWCNLNLANVYQSLNKLPEYEKHLTEGFIIAREINHKELLLTSYEQLSDIYEKQGSYKQALNYQKLYTAIKDTIYNTESSKQITEMNTKYETEKKDKELIKKDAEINLQQVQTEKQTVIKNGFIIGFVFLLGLIIFVYRGYVQKQKTNKLLNEKNQKITDSINYAKIIQSSILPSTDELKKYLPESFIFYQPKDIVSGDFYWLYPINETTVVFAVVDCTGHGVPGALMSMLGYSLLEQIINQNKTTQPSKILDQLNDLVKDSLKQSGNEDTVKNGMDMVIFKLDYSTYELEFAGAKNPLYIVRNQNLIELKGDRKSIGLSTGNTNPYTNQHQQLQAGDHLYAFSDGYIDQKGGTDSKKFYSSNFQKLLISINPLNANEQHERIKTTFTNWKGTKEQMDDVLVFGVKV